MLDKLVTAFKLAADTNQALLSEYPGLTTLLGARSAIAQKAASTKRLNQKAIAEGKPAVHGAAGKKRQRAAEKAAAAAQQAQAAQASNGASAPAPAAQPQTAPTPANGGARTS